MHCVAKLEGGTGLLTIDIKENCHTDAMPLVQQITVDNAEFDIRSGAFALAVALLVRRYCGDVINLEPGPLGLEYARAIGSLCERAVNVTPVAGLDRAHSTGELDVVCAPARMGSVVWTPPDTFPVLSVDWSGDPVEATSRRSQGHRQGRFFTNAALVTDETSVSIALGLMHAGSACRNLIVPAPKAAGKSFDEVARALAMVGVALQLIA